MLGSSAYIIRCNVIRYVMLLDGALHVVITDKYRLNALRYVIGHDKRLIVLAVGLAAASYSRKLIQGNTLCPSSKSLQERGQT